MGKSWQLQDQKDFINSHLTSYTRSSDEGKLQEFWPTFMKEWFEHWPLSEPPPELITKKGTVKKARKAWKKRKVEVSILSQDVQF